MSIHQEKFAINPIVIETILSLRFLARERPDMSKTPQIPHPTTRPTAKNWIATPNMG
jgi:hypothetical protein